MKTYLLSLGTLFVVQLSAQSFQPRYIIDFEGGISKSKFSQAPAFFANQSQLGLGKSYQLAAERIIKGSYGVGLQLCNTTYTYSNTSLAESSQNRLATIPEIRSISSDQTFGVAQTCFLVSGSYLKQKNHWQLQGSVSAGLGLMNYNSSSTGFVQDSVKSTSFFYLSTGTTYAYTVESSRYLAAKAQFTLRYILNPNDKTAVAFFAGMGLTFQRVKMEYVLQDGPETLLGSKFEHFQTVSAWQQNISNLNLRAGISIILNKNSSKNAQIQ